jgi:hypothetical protein
LRTESAQYPCSGVSYPIRRQILRKLKNELKFKLASSGFREMDDDILLAINVT